jgi:hypothetical protein
MLNGNEDAHAHEDEDEDEDVHEDEDERFGRAAGPIVRRSMRIDAQRAWPPSGSERHFSRN